MSSSLGNQASGLRALSQRFNYKSLMKACSGMRESEAQHLLDMLRDATETLERVERHGEAD